MNSRIKFISILAGAAFISLLFTGCFMDKSAGPVPEFDGTLVSVESVLVDANGKKAKLNKSVYQQNVEAAADSGFAYDYDLEIRKVELSEDDEATLDDMIHLALADENLTPISGEGPYLLVYYSAHWCPPCRWMSPQLVEFYNNNGGGEAFEILFASSDKSEEKLFEYMHDAGMPWWAIQYSAISGTKIKDHDSHYIPSITVFDRNGDMVLKTNYDGGMEPATILAKLLLSLDQS